MRGREGRREGGREGERKRGGERRHIAGLQVTYMGSFESRGCVATPLTWWVVHSCLASSSCSAVALSWARLTSGDCVCVCVHIHNDKHTNYIYYNYTPHSKRNTTHHHGNCSVSKHSTMIIYFLSPENNIQMQT